ncbi:hypothetical protein [Metapseudomonas resinovorans]|uniref:hypothetical protein n=1 Tax=Metapseudomonas resinovorans TaxID=53412 RepID=UPI00146C05A2|nr:hypothetical protein [Pseudomonas resinovorans]
MRDFFAFAPASHCPTRVTFMDHQSTLRWYLLFPALTVSFGWLIAPDTEPPGASISNQDDWVPVSLQPHSVDPAGAKRLAEMLWWGGERSSSETRDKEKRVSTGEDGVARVEVAWRFHGIVRDHQGTFALISKGATTPPLRFSRGAILPGGERLELISTQGIRFSLAEDGEIQGFDRELYAPQQ